MNARESSRRSRRKTCAEEIKETVFERVRNDFGRIEVVFKKTSVMMFRKNRKISERRQWKE